MKDQFACPACGTEQWERLQRYTYQRREPDLVPYLQRTRRVLFEAWQPGATAVELWSVLCQECGFAAYTPRPTEDDIDAKYRFHHGDAEPPASVDETPRAERTYRAVTDALGHQPERVLDYGGADGKLLAPFIADGADGAVIDYHPSTRAGVRKIGDTVDSLKDETFDAIVCSHVLEHLVHPRAVLRVLANHLEPHGVLYVEVPSELWRRVPIELDPVTHVNFFTAASLKSLLVGAGFAPLSCSEQRGSYAGAEKAVVVAIARPGDAVDSRDGVRLARKRLAPTLAFRARRKLALR